MTDRSACAAGTPRWVKITAIVTGAVLVVVVLVLVFGGGHGPGRHGAGGDPAPARVAPGGHAPPDGNR